MPMVTVNPHITNTLEATIARTDNADVTSGSTSVHNGIGFMQAKEQDLSINFDEIDPNIRLR